MNNILAWMFVGLLFGVLIGQISLLFFQNEIFNFMDRLVARVRSWCGLDG